MHSQRIRPCKISLALPIALLATTLAGPHPAIGQDPAPAQAGQSRHELSNKAYRLTMILEGDTLRATLEDKATGLIVADGPCVYRAVKTGQPDASKPAEGLKNASLAINGENLVLKGRLAGLALEQTFTLSANRPIMEERITLRNDTAALVSLADLEIGLTRRVADKDGQVLPELSADRWVAVPFRIRATDPKDHLNDFSIADLISKPGEIPRVDGDLRVTSVPSPHRHSEGWAWTHGQNTLGIFAFCQENMLFSLVSATKNPEGGFLRFGGACMMNDEPAALTRIAPGQTVDLGLTRYQTVPGTYREAAYAFRAMLDEKGCRFPKDFNPPVHWEQLYDMPGAWNDRPNLYTREIVEKEAVKGRDYSCEALYLDPGWDTAFGSFIWGEKWLGPQKQFAEDMQSKYGLKLSLHCPLLTWVSHKSTWGADAAECWPKEAARIAPPDPATDEQTGKLRVPAQREGRRNLALSPDARAEASSVLEGYAVHQIAHLNDGWYGNIASWIPAQMPAWAQIDLGDAHVINEVRLGNEHSHEFADRFCTHLRILTATQYDPDSNAKTWSKAAEYTGQGFQDDQAFTFSPTNARWVRVEMLEAKEPPRLDEIEVYEQQQTDPEKAKDYEKIARRGANPFPAPGPTLCMGSRQYLDEAEKRLLANCANGATFLMYDGNWWNGGCVNPNHGHPVPYLVEDHVRANLDLVRRVHAKYPNVLIELHDCIAGCNRARATPIYYKYGLPGSYDDNWGFELMWNPMDDLREGRGRALYYYNLGCNVPVYLHIDLRGDNEHGLMLWWFASTCRHLGIGGTHDNPTVVASHKEAMKIYRKLDRLYKRGDFYGITDEMHIHAIPQENAFVVNVFNLSDEPRTITGRVDLKSMGLDPNRSYTSTADWVKANKGEVEVKDGAVQIKLDMPPWSAQVVDFH